MRLAVANIIDARIIGISIHALRVECDASFSPAKSEVDHYFNPRTPCGVRRVQHTRSAQNICYFNPRTPCGVRLGPRYMRVRLCRLFQSTHSVWSATPRWRRKICPVAQYFNPRTPCGVRLPLSKTSSILSFSISFRDLPQSVKKFFIFARFNPNSNYVWFTFAILKN